MILAAANGVTLHLSGTLDMILGKVHVIFLVIVFAEGNSAASASVNLAVLDDPAHAPVRSNHAVLVGSRRSPGGGSFVDIEAADCDVIYVINQRHEAVSSDTDLNLFLVGVELVEVGIENCFICLFILFCVPEVLCSFLIPGQRIAFSLLAFLKGADTRQDASIAVKNLVRKEGVSVNEEA